MEVPVGQPQSSVTVMLAVAIPVAALTLVLMVVGL
jgi:hypothetical protein